MRIKVRALLVVLLAASFVFPPALSSRPLGPWAALSGAQRAVMARLHRLGLDVAGPGFAWSKRKVLRPVRDYFGLAVDRPSALSIPHSAMSLAQSKHELLALERGATRIHKPTGLSNAEGTHLARWQTSDTVFIHHTFEDRKQAARIVGVLEDKGFVAYSYLNGQEEPWASAEYAGWMLQTADHHLLLDTVQVHKSPGVAVEAGLLQKLWTSGLSTQTAK